MKTNKEDYLDITGGEADSLFKTQATITKDQTEVTESI